MASLIASGCRIPTDPNAHRRQVPVDAGKQPGGTSKETGELKPLRRENVEPKRANAILKERFRSASANQWFAALGVLAPTLKRDQARMVSAL